jgi:PDZ domain-containing secreted protein
MSRTWSGGAYMRHTVQVIPRSPAADAGLRFGDVLTALDAQPLTSSPQLQTLISEAEVNQVVRLRVRRSGSEKVSAASVVFAWASRRRKTERRVGSNEQHTRTQTL